MSNNPFIEQPFDSVSSSFDRRFPSISDTGSPPSAGQWNQPSYQQQQQQPYSPYGQPQQYPQQQQNAWANQPPQVSSPAPGGFQPSSSFGQQLASQLGQGAYGQQQQQPQLYAQGGYQQSSYGQQQQQPTGYGGQPNNGYAQQGFSQFDPYAGAGDFLGGVGPTPPSATGHNRSVSSSSIGGGNPGQQGGFQDLHPREYVRQHKAELETWDTYSWKQCTNSFESLQRAWEQRKHEVDMRINQLAGPGSYYDYGMQQEAARLQGLSRDASVNFDSVAASLFQMREILEGYRQSGDAASKRRVKESINAALTSLPDWPPQQW